MYGQKYRVGVQFFLIEHLLFQLGDYKHASLKTTHTTRTDSKFSLFFKF